MAKEETKAKAVDQDGNPVDADIVDKDGNVIKPKKTLKEKAIMAGKIVGGVVLALAAGGIGYVAGGKKVGKVKDKEIRDLRDTNDQLYRENFEMSVKLEAKEPEKEEESEEEVEEINF